MNEEGRIDYIEIPVTDLEKTREFFSSLFGWSFQEWGPDYFSFNDGRLECGLRRAEQPAPATGVLLIFLQRESGTRSREGQGTRCDDQAGDFRVSRRTAFSFCRSGWHRVRNVVERGIGNNTRSTDNAPAD